MKIYIVVPAFNEQETIGQVVTSLLKITPHVVVVDDGSTDLTSHQVPSPATFIYHPINLGQGAALQTGLDYARSQNADIVITYDADGQFDPQDIPLFLKPLQKNQADVVLGSRFLGKTINIPFSKKIVLKLGTIFTRIFSHLHLTDTHNGLRGFNQKALSKIHLTRNRMSHASEILHQIRLHKLKYLEVPVTVRYTDYSRKKGQSIFNSINIFLDLLNP